MATFSERMGIRPVRDTMQVNTADEALRAALWNALGKHCFPNEHEFIGFGRLAVREVLPDDCALLTKLWTDFLHWPYDELDAWADVRARLKRHFFTCQWYAVLDLVEFVAGVKLDQALLWQKSPANNAFVQQCNRVLKQHNSAYHFIGRQLVCLTDEQETAAIEEALAATGASNHLAPVHEHLKQALTHLSDRQAPDFRASMKESISAVEAIGGLIVGSSKPTLGEVLSKIERQGKLPLHASLKEGFLKLYGYTSDAEGIRHALKDKPTVDYDDAKLLLVECTAFVNWLIAKAAKAGISL